MPLRDPALAAFFGPVDTASGVAVNEYTAFNSSAVFAAVRLISEAMGLMECVLQEEKPNKDDPDQVDKIEAKAHPLWNLLHEEPNPEMTPMSFFSTITAHCLTWGNGYAEIVRDGAGRPAQYWPIPPNRVRPRRVLSDNPRDRTICYDIFPNIASPYALQALPINNGGEEMVTIPYWNMLHVPGLGFDGLLGYSVVTCARESIGLTMATEQFGASFFGRGSRPSGVLTHPGKMKKEARINLRESWEKAYQGLSNAQRVALLEEGVKWEAIGIPPEDAQFLQTRAFQIAEICRWFNVPPHMLRDLSRATFSNIEHQGMDFVTYSLMPWIVRVVQELRRKSLTAEEKKRYLIAFLYQVLQRGDFLSRMQGYQMGIQNGILCPDEARALEGMNHRSDGLGKEFRRPANILPDTAETQAAGLPAPGATDPAAIPAPDAADDPKDKKKKAAKAAKKAKAQKQRAALIAAQRAVLAEALERMVSVEVKHLTRAAGDTKRFLAAVEEFYERFPGMLSKALEPGLRAHLALLDDGRDAAALVQSLASEYVADSKRELLDASGAPPDKFQAGIETLLKRWEVERPRALADKLIIEEIAATAAA
ncbi:MAG: phage portal protein [Elusimicrobia bacterium]|nr:phage portal protein [Elusimicrobiota bacterium]